MPDEVTQKIGDFLTDFYGDRKGYANIATLEGGVGEFKSLMIMWPEKKAEIIRFALMKDAEGKDVFFAPNLYARQEGGGKPRPKKEFLLPGSVLFADFDKQTAPEDWADTCRKLGIPEPSHIVQSSVPGNQHAYWNLTDSEQRDFDWLEDRSRSIAAQLGADMSGWDATQLLRIPGLHNYGYDNEQNHKAWYKGEPVEVTLLKRSDSVEPRHFEALATAEKKILDSIELKEIPSFDEALALGPTNKEVLRVVKMTAQEATDASPHKRSGSLQFLMYIAAEAGFDNEQMYALVDHMDRKWGKYIESHSAAGRHKILLDTIAKARAKVGYPADNESLDIMDMLTKSPTIEDTRVAFDFLEFLEADFKMEWIFSNWMAKNSLGILTGQPGTGKTQLGINIAIHLALGKPFLAWNNEAGPIKVLFLSLEMPGPPLQYFMHKIAKGYEDHRGIAKNLTIIPTGTGLPLDRPEGIAFLQNLLAEYKPDIVFFDSLQKMTSESLSDEKSTKTLMGNLDKLRQKYDCGMYIIHHDRKKGNNSNKEDAGELSDMYGSQFISANLDWVFSLSKDSDNPGQLLLSDWKNRLSPQMNSPMDLVRDSNLNFTVPGIDMSINITREDGTMGTGVSL